MQHKNCFDPFSKHKKKIKENLREISLLEAKKIQNKLNIQVIPGMKYCTNCLIALNCQLTEIDNASKTSQTTADEKDASICLSQPAEDSQNINSQAISFRRE